MLKKNKKSVTSVIGSTAFYTGRSLLKASKFGARHLGRALTQYGGNTTKIHSEKEQNGSGLEDVIRKPLFLSAKKPISNTLYKFDSSYHPDMHDLTIYFQNEGIVGEEPVYLLSTLGLIGGQSVMIKGPSGSGKTKIHEAMLSLVPESLYFRLGLTTLAALSRDQDRINKAQAIYVGEFQKVMGNKDLKEAFKDISNGDPFRRTISSAKGGIDEFIIRGDLSLHTAIADQNSFKTVFDNYTEAYRRFIHLHTRLCGDITKDVLDSKASQDLNPFAETVVLAGDEMSRLTNQLSACMTNNNFGYINPFAEFIKEHIPIENSLVSAFVDHYRDLIKDYAKFHVQDRVKVKDNGTTYVFCNLEDVMRVHELYAPHFIKSLNECDPHSKNSNLEDFSKSIDWQDCFDHGLDKMEQMYSPIAEEWLQKQEYDGCIASINPVTGDREAIAEYKGSIKMRTIHPAFEIFNNKIAKDVFRIRFDKHEK